MIEKIADIIRKGRTFLVTSHVRLDGDAVGSELALYEALRGLGKEAVLEAIRESAVTMQSLRC